jgi:hypothetical protein
MPKWEYRTRKTGSPGNGATFHYLAKRGANKARSQGQVPPGEEGLNGTARARSAKGDRNQGIPWKVSGVATLETGCWERLEEYGVRSKRKVKAWLWLTWTTGGTEYLGR